MSSGGATVLEEGLARLRDPHWRLRNLYWIVDKDGRELKFSPWPEQQRFVDRLWYRNLVLKSRQRGFSTVIQLMMLDRCLSVPNTSAAVIAQGKDEAEEIFRTKLKFAYDRLPASIREVCPLVKETAASLVFGNGSSLRVTTSGRSATLQFLHVSEFGTICAKYPDKAEEIVTGALPAVDQNGIVCIESTARGQEGAFYDMAMRAIELDQLCRADPSRKLAKSDYRFHFAPWWEAPEYTADPAKVAISPADNAYFARLEAELGRQITPEQRAWYVGKRDADFGGDRELMMREYPATPEEAFAQSVDGVYLADQLAAARREGRITAVPHDPGRPVNTFWDLSHGGNDDVAIWFHQRVGLRDHFIRFIEGSGEPYGYYVKQTQELGYVWGKHYLPHDADRRFPGAEATPTIRDMLEGLGLRNIEIVPRIADVTAGIQMMRDDFGHYWFDETNCAAGLKHLGLYRKEWNDRLGCWRETPREDGHQHAADALRQKAQAYSEPTTYRRRAGRRSAMAA